MNNEVDSSEVLDLKCSDDVSEVTFTIDSCEYVVVVPCSQNDCNDRRLESPSSCVDGFSIKEVTKNGEFAGAVVASEANVANAINVEVSLPDGYSAMSVVFVNGLVLDTQQIHAPTTRLNFVASCNEDQTIVDVVLPVSNNGSGELCDGWEEEDALYSFVVSCISNCADAATDHMNEESFKQESIEDADDMFYCESQDYPCEGEEPNMVYVCHYSPRTGYQTFCVPEADSDILRFYPHDYCGKCEGGFGNDQDEN